MLVAKQTQVQMRAEDSETDDVLTDSRSRSTSSSGELKSLSDGTEVQQMQAPKDIQLKHPLEHTWTLWYLENDRSKSWEDMQNEITSFDMVEDFWSLYNHIKPPSEIKIGSDYSLFKKGILPMWEDQGNKCGGRWVINMGRCTKLELDKLWLDVLLILIGETFEHSTEICGAVINLRGKTNKISIWTANGHNEVAVIEIGRKLRDLLGFQAHQLQYQLHKDLMTKQGSPVKAVYVV
ncbi:uncharacterized protein Dwil_GK12583 [Drosophila willistoni]|uniref:eIF-4F 25 kDa subunit n=1 Tax=Drosophila willistoni TaxID=7260 RepID=B4N2Y0_DROWI|nr:eukaryotic translation initiation factor 4E1 [Drosophila willistoni]XP_046867664.1 eukaryotic translation initiation factor 4E1 [Drosophila willistoni]EDW78719.2 uncharacterized protein Dwil_GK12583 [Drosophila willistoni]